MKNLIYITVIFLALFSCKKEEGNEPLPAISDVPEIELVSINSASINQFDDLIFTIKYTDGDGDLGTEDADVPSIFVKDNRDATIVHAYHLQPLAPSNEDITLQGNLLINVENVILLNQSNTTENATFSIHIVDRAGNKSNTLTTSSIRISK